MKTLNIIFMISCLAAQALESMMLAKIWKKLDSVPTLGSYYRELNKERPGNTSDAEWNSPAFSVFSVQETVPVKVKNTVDVNVSNTVDANVSNTVEVKTTWSKLDVEVSNKLYQPIEVKFVR